MKITLKTLKGQQLPLEVQPDMTVRVYSQISACLPADMDQPCRSCHTGKPSNIFYRRSYTDSFLPIGCSLESLYR